MAKSKDGKGDHLKLVEPWNEKPGIQNKLEIDDSTPFFVFDESEITFDDENPENDLIEDYKFARKNAHYVIQASKAMLKQMQMYFRYDANPLVADACVKLLKTISDNNRDVIKLQEDVRKTKLIGKPKADDVPDNPDEKEDKLTATVTEIVDKHEEIKAKRKAEKEGKEP